MAYTCEISPCSQAQLFFIGLLFSRQLANEKNYIYIYMFKWQRNQPWKWASSSHLLSSSFSWMGASGLTDSASSTCPEAVCNPISNLNPEYHICEDSQEIFCGRMELLCFCWRQEWVLEFSAISLLGLECKPMLVLWEAWDLLCIWSRTLCSHEKREDPTS